MPQYYGAQNGPAAWASEQQSRRDNQIRDILNMMMQMKNFQTDQGWKQKEWDTGLATDEFNQGQAERRTAASELSANSLANQRAEEDPVIQQARILVETGQAKDLGTAIRMIKGIKTVDEEVSLEVAKGKAKERAGLGGSERSPNAQFDQSLNIQKQLTDMGNFLESEITGLRGAKRDITTGGYIDDETKTKVADLEREIAEKTKRMNKARSLGVRFTPYLNKTPDQKLMAEAGAFLGGTDQAPPPPISGRGLIDWMGPQQGQVPPPPPGFTIVK